MQKALALLLILELVLYTAATPAQYNWAELFCAPPVRNQADCGSCYAFSTASVVGSSLCHQAANLPLLDLSPQFVLDLNYNEQNDKINPCAGGFPYQQVHFLSTRSEFATCNADCSAGCMPYSEGDCMEPSPSVNPFNYMETNCNDECVCNSFEALQCTGSGSMKTLINPQLSFDYKPVLDNEHASIDTESSTIQKLKDALTTYGPISIAVDASGLANGYWSSNLRCPGESAAYTAQSDKCPAGACLVKGAKAGWLPVPGLEGYWSYQCASEKMLPLSGNSNGQLNHAVTLVGWKQLNGQDVWYVTSRTNVVLSFQDHSE